MASSGSIDSGGYQGRVLHFEWWTNSTDPVNNTRQVGYRITAIGGSSTNYYHHNNTVSITGNTVYSGGSADYISRDTVLAEGIIGFNQTTDPYLIVEMHGGVYTYDDNINTSYSWQLDTIASAPVFTVQPKVTNKTVNSITFDYGTVNIDSDLYYSLNNPNPSSWIHITQRNTTINGLTPNTNYTIYVQARNPSNHSLRTTTSITTSTYEIAKIISVYDFNFGDANEITIINDSNASINLQVKINENEILTMIPVAGENIINYTQEQLDNIYKQYDDTNSVTATYILTTTENNISYEDISICEIILTGNQKTINTKIDDEWKRGKLWVNIDDNWKQAVVWTKDTEDNWKRGI